MKNLFVSFLFISTSLFAQLPVNHGYGTVDTTTVLVSKPYLDSKLNKIDNYLGNGIISGFTISINSDNTKINISSGVGYIVDNSNPSSPIFTPLNYAGTTALSLTYISSANATYLAVNSTGTILQQITEFTPTQRRSCIPIGAAVHSNKTNVNVVNNLPDVALNGISQFNDFLDAFGNFNISGNVISANGTNLSINKSDGYIFKKGANFVNDAANPHWLHLPALTAPSNIRYRLSNGTEYSNTSFVDPSHYENNGVLSNVTSGYTIPRITIFPSNLIRIQYGQTKYSSLSAALQAISTDPFIDEANMKANGLKRALLLLRYDATDLTNTNHAQFFETSQNGSSTSLSSGGGTTTLQQSYDNSLQPQITTSTTLGAVQIKRGSSSDNDTVFQILKGSGSSSLSVLGTGDLILSNSTLSKTVLKSNSSNVTPTITLPSNTGTLALTSQLPTTAMYMDSITLDSVELRTNVIKEIVHNSDSSVCIIPVRLLIKYIVSTAYNITLQCEIFQSGVNVLTIPLTASVQNTIYNNSADASNVSNNSYSIFTGNTEPLSGGKGNAVIYLYYYKIPKGI